MWFIFSVTHSLFASAMWKRKMQTTLNINYKFYRIIYSLFSLISLILILFYNSMRSILLWQVYMFEKLFSCIVMVLSALIMLIFTWQFFFDLSGAHIFHKKQVPRQFIQISFYKYVRHPLYSATLMFIWSIFLWKPFLNNLVTCICITCYTFIGIILEERKLINEFGENYITYKSTTPMLFPRL